MTGSNSLRAFLIENKFTRSSVPKMEGGFIRDGTSYWSHGGKYYLRAYNGDRKEITAQEYDDMLRGDLDPEGKRPGSVYRTHGDTKSHGSKKRTAVDRLRKRQAGDQAQMLNNAQKQGAEAADAAGLDSENKKGFSLLMRRVDDSGRYGNYPAVMRDADMSFIGKVDKIEDGLLHLQGGKEPIKLTDIASDFANGFGNRKFGFWEK